MSKFIKTAKSWTKQGYSVIPVTANKNPSLPGWRKYQKKSMTDEEVDFYFKDAKGIAVLCGGEARLFCLDIDSKYDLSTTLFEDLKASIPKKILRKMYCQQTQSGGYHLIFKVPSSRLFGNQKFASRYTTAYEKHLTYLDAFRDPETCDKALKIASGDKIRVLLESRSGDREFCGGYFLTSPSPGYSPLGGKIGDLTEEEYDTVIEAARSFNQVITEHKIHNEDFYKVDWELSPFDHFNSEGDGVQLLLDAGWSIVANYGKDVRLKRPGKTSTIYSGVYDTNKKIFNCYTTSTDFETGKGYSNTGLLILLEHENDPANAFRALVTGDWGIKKTEK